MDADYFAAVVAARLALARDAWDDALARGDLVAADRISKEVAELEAKISR